MQKRLVSLALLVGLGACSPITDQTELPELAALAFTEASAAVGNPIELVGTLAAGEMLTSSMRLSVTLDGQTFLMHPEICVDPTEGEYKCGEMLMGLRDGHVPGEVTGALEDLGTIWRVLGPPQARYVIWADVGDGDLNVALSTFGQHEAVEWVHRNAVFRNTTFPVSDRVRLTVGTTETTADARHLLVHSGVEIVATYVQPDGSTIQAEIAVIDP